MKPTYIYLAFIAILLWNGMLIKRDQELFKAHDACIQSSYNPDCPYKK